MFKQNLIDLTPGDNRIIVSGDDLGIFSGRFPIIRIPENNVIYNAHIEILSPFIISAGKFINTTSIPKMDFELGDSLIKDYFIKRVDGSKIGISNPCSGEYFNDMSLITPQTIVYLTTYSFIRPWSVSKDMNNSKKTGCGGGSETGSFFVYAGNTRITEVFENDVWTIGNPISVNRTEAGGCGGVKNAVCFGGANGGTILNTSEKYNGITWSSSGNMNHARRRTAGAGNSTAAVAFCGSSSSGIISSTEEYNGSIWSLSNSTIFARERHSGTGSIYSAISFGGASGISAIPFVTSCEIYNGASWFIGPDIIYSRRAGTGGGELNDAYYAGGINNGQHFYVEEFDGSSWKISNNLLSKRGELQSGFYLSDVMVMGGNNSFHGDLISTEQRINISTPEMKLSGSMIINLTIL